MKPAQRRHRALLMFIAAAVLALPSLPLGGIGFGMLVAPRHSADSETGLACATVSVVLFSLLSLPLILLGLAQRRRARRLDLLEALGKSHARFSIQQAEAALDVTPGGAQPLILEAIRVGLLRGRLDVQDSTFVSETVTTGVIELVGDCRACGATAVRTHITATERPRCHYCGGILEATPSGGRSHREDP